MRKTKFIFGVVVGVLLLTFSGCVTFSTVNPGTSNPTSTDYKVVGIVENEFSSNVLFGFISWGDNKRTAIQELREKAREVNADDVINISLESTASVYPFFYQYEFTLRGTAIKYN